MNAVIEIYGKGGNFECVPYLPNWAVSSDGYFNIKTISEKGFSAAISINNGVRDVKFIKVCRSHCENPYLHLKVDSIFSDVTNLKSNVELKITYSFNLFQWAGYGFVNLIRKVRK